MNQPASIESMEMKLKQQDGDMTASILGSLSLRGDEAMPIWDLLTEAVSNYREVHGHGGLDYAHACARLIDLTESDEINRSVNSVTFPQ